MVRQWTTKNQVSGYKFLISRLNHALVRRDVRMLHDPMKLQNRSLLAGILIATIITAVAGALALFRPQGSIDGAKIFVGKNSGGLYVLIKDTVHPVLNIASARLLTQSNQIPKPVSETKLANYSKGPTLGIVGAPNAILPSNSPDSIWTVCDDTQENGLNQLTVLAGELLNKVETKSLLPDQAVLVQAGGKDYLLYQGKKSEVSATDASVIATFNLANVTIKKVSPGFLNAIEENPPIKLPEIVEAGKLAKFTLPGVDAIVGKVIMSQWQKETNYYVILSEGIQKITEAAAKLLSFGYSKINANNSNTGIETISSSQLTNIKLLHSLPVDYFPEKVPTILDGNTFSTNCLEWRKSFDTNQIKRNILLSNGLRFTNQEKLIQYPSVTEAATKLNAYYQTPSTGEYIQVTGATGNIERRDTLYYISDMGVKYGILDEPTAKILGLTADPKLAPWSIISLLIDGAVLTKTNAAIAHYSFPNVDGDEAIATEDS